MNRCFPNGLQFSKHFFAQVAAVAPALSELMQLTRHAFPIWAIRMLDCPSLDLFDQGQALCFVSSSLGTGFFEPHINHFMGAVAGCVKAFPQGGVGRGFFVYFFPLLTQVAQGFLHLAAAHRGNTHHVVGFSCGCGWSWCGGIRCRSGVNGVHRHLRYIHGFNYHVFGGCGRFDGHGRGQFGFRGGLFDRGCFFFHGLGHRRWLEQGLGLHGQL